MARNKFSVLEDDNGQAVFEEEKIVKLTNYFQNLFTSQDANPVRIQEVITTAIKPIITEEMNQELIKEPDAEEIKQAMFLLVLFHPDKAPGLMGFLLVSSSPTGML